MYAGENSEVSRWRVAIRLRHISIAAKSRAGMLAVCAAISLGCTSSNGTGARPLTITPAEAATVYTSEQAAALDFGLTVSVKLQLLFDRKVSARHINVDTRDRVVSLKGVVEADTKKARAVRIARETHGVACVIDQLTVRMP